MRSVAAAASAAAAATLAFLVKPVSGIKAENPQSKMVDNPTRGINTIMAGNV